MALIKCPECEKEISDKVKACPHCGFPLVEESATDDIQKVEVSSVKLKKMNPKKKKVLITTIISIVVIFAAIGIIMSMLSNNITNEERYAIRNTQNIKDMLNDPNSLTLYDDVLVLLSEDEDNDLEYYTYISYGAKNSYGAMARDVAMYKGYVYIGTFAEVDDVNATDFVKKTKKEQDRHLEMLEAKQSYFASQLGRDSVKNQYIIKKEKVLRMLE